MKVTSTKCIAECRKCITQCQKCCELNKNKVDMKECCECCECCIIICNAVCEMLKCDDCCDMTKRLCMLCASCCKKCATQCAKIKDNKVCKDCSVACKTCETACKRCGTCKTVTKKKPTKKKIAKKKQKGGNRTKVLLGLSDGNRKIMYNEFDLNKTWDDMFIHIHQTLGKKNTLDNSKILLKLQVCDAILIDMLIELDIDIKKPIIDSIKKLIHNGIFAEHDVRTDMYTMSFVIYDRDGEKTKEIKKYRLSKSLLGNSKSYPPKLVIGTWGNKQVRITDSRDNKVYFILDEENPNDITQGNVMHMNLKHKYFS